MSIQKYLETSELNKIMKYDSMKGYNKNCVSYAGCPRKHPYDNEKMLLFPKPIDSKKTFFEFKLNDIKHVEELPGISNIDGETVTMAKIWVDKGSFGIKYEPFEVG